MLYLPASQSVQADTPAALYLPATQSMQTWMVFALVPVWVEYLPASQLMHASGCAAGLYLPASQFLHSSGCAAALYLPASQSAQADAPAAL